MNRNFTESIALYQRAVNLIPGGSQTNSKRAEAFAFGAYPIYASHGKGGRVWDVDGNEYIDFVSALGPVSLGYAVPEVDDAVRAQLSKGMIYGLLSPLEVEVAELLQEIVPCAQMVRYFKGGGEATAAAARIARGYTGRPVVLTNGYRGWPDVWTALHNDGGVPPAFAGTVQSFTWADLPDLERQLEANAGQVAAVFVEVHYQPPAGYLEGVQALCRKHGALLVYDEIVTGFRLAPGGAQERFGVVPDMACFAKGIANGLPLAAVAGRRDVMAKAKDLLISITYGGEALSLAGAAACLKLYRDGAVSRRLWELGARLKAGLNKAADEAGIAFSSYGHDPMAWMEFAAVAGVEPGDLWSYFLQETAARGVLFRRSGLNFVMWSHTEAEIDQAVSTAAEVFHQMRRWLDEGAPRHALRVQRLEESFLRRSR